MSEEKQNGLPENKQAEEKEKRAAEHFVKGALIRGEAAKSQNGELPPDAVYEIVEEKEGKLPKIRRDKFKFYSSPFDKGPQRES